MPTKWLLGKLWHILVTGYSDNHLKRWEAKKKKKRWEAEMPRTDEVKQTSSKQYAQDSMYVKKM